LLIAISKYQQASIANLATVENEALRK